MMNSDLSTTGKIAALLTSSDRRELAALFVLMIVGMLLEMLGVGLVIPALMLMTDADAVERFPVLEPLVAALGNPSREVLIIAGMVALVAVYLVKNAFLGMLIWRETRFTSRLNVQLSQRLFAAYLSRPYTFHLQRNSAHLINSISNEVITLTSAGLGAGLRLMTEAVVIAGLGVLLLAVEPGATIAIGAAGFMVGWGVLHTTRSRIQRWALARRHHSEMTYQHLQQGLGAAKDVIVLGREEGFLAQYLWHNTRLAHLGQRHEVIQHFPRIVLEIFAVTALASLTIILMLQGRPPATLIPTLGLFAAVAFRILPSVNRILHSVQSLRFAVPAVDRLHADLATMTPADRKTPSRGRELNDRFEMRGVTYTYPSAEEPALRRISLSIERGESIGIVGPSGAGKSTLIDVFLGLLVPATGNILVDGRDLQEDVRGWQDQIGYVPQVIYLTDDTLRRNVAFGLSDDRIDEDAVWRAVRAAELEAFVRNSPQGLDTVIGERGIRISGGERQRIGIARALYHDPNVLVLDEATSSLDTQTERSVMETVRGLHRLKTIVIVSHRFSTIEHCDRVYELDRGVVIEKDWVRRSTTVDA